MVFRVRRTETDTKLAAMTVKLAEEIEEETGVHAGFLRNGGITVATDEAWLHELKIMHTVRDS